MCCHTDKKQIQEIKLSNGRDEGQRKAEWVQMGRKRDN